MPFALCCKNTKSLKDISSLNNSSPRLPPSIPPLAPSSSSSSPVNIRGLAQMSEGTVLQSCDWALHSPAPWRGEKQDFISYASFPISAITRGICRRVSSVVFLMRCYTSSPLMHMSQEQLCFQRNQVCQTSNWKLFFFFCLTGSLKAFLTAVKNSTWTDISWGIMPYLALRSYCS